MNHDFLLKTEAPIIPISVGKSQSLSNQGDDKNIDNNQGFSSELGKQIDQPLATEKRVERAGVATEPTQTTSAEASQKAATISDKDGKPLPSEGDIAEEFVTQLLADFEGDPTLKKALAEKIEQLVNTLLGEQDSELDLKDSLAVFLADLVKAGLGEGELKGGQATNASVSRSSIEALNETALTGSTTQSVSQDGAAKLKQTSLTAQGGAITLPQTDSILEQGLGQKTTLLSQISVAINDNTKTPEQIAILERMQSLLQQIKADVTKESSAGMAQKSDKAALIAELIKKIIPETQPASKGSETVSSGKETIISTQLSQLRPDILQALSKKPLGSDAVNLNTSDILKTVISKTDSISFDDKKLERMTQLVDSLKPLRTDDPQLRTQNTDKPIPTSIPATQTTPSGLTPKADLPSLDIQPSLQSKAWNQVLSSRVVWMATEGLQQAALKLNPANLGPVEVRLRVQNEQVNVTFIAQNPATRDALEQALPRLRESFVENGMALTHADVSDQASQEAREDETQKNNSDNQGSQNGDITTVSSAEQNSDKTVTNVEQNNEAGVNVYA